MRGVFSAAFTAIAPDQSIDLPRMTGHCRRLLGEGCDGVALLGTTGEANSLATRERRQVLEAVVAGGVPAERLFPGTGVCAFSESVELTRHALSLGVRTVLLLPPFYYKDPSETGLLDFYTRVIEGVADDRLRVVLYHIPQMTMVPLSVELIATLVDRFGPVIAGIKDSSGDFAHMERLIARFPTLSVLAGADHLLGPVLRAGGAGCITATSNLIAPLLAELAAEARSGAPAEDYAGLERRIGLIRALFQRWPQIPALKAALGLRTGDSDWDHVRPPMQPLSETQKAEMREAMSDLDFA